MQYPAVIIPFSIADPTLDPKDKNFVPKDDLNRGVEAMCKPLPLKVFFLSFGVFAQHFADDPEVVAGAPIGLQIVGPRFGDAQLLHDVEALDSILNA